VKETEWEITSKDARIPFSSLGLFFRLLRNGADPKASVFGTDWVVAFETFQQTLNKA
jgi:hypothetical protein